MSAGVLRIHSKSIGKKTHGARSNIFDGLFAQVNDGSGLLSFEIFASDSQFGAASSYKIEKAKGHKKRDLRR